MANSTEYIINFKGLRSGEHVFEYELDKEFFEDYENPVIEDAEVHVKLVFDKTTETLFNLNFHLTGFLSFSCNRCLDLIKYPLNQDYKQFIKLENSAETIDDDLAVLPLETQQLNVKQFIFEFATILIPMKQTCELINKPCNEVMLAKLGELSDQGKQDNGEIDPRWLELKKAFDKKSNNNKNN